jgi:hypothetical protein
LFVMSLINDNLISYAFWFQVAKQSVRDEIFDVGHHDAVKAKLRTLLTSEMVLVSDMTHDGDIQARSIEEEGDFVCFKILQSH